MHAEFFFDTNIPLYAASNAKSEQNNRTKARDLLAMEGGGLSVQVQAEFYVNATGKFKLFYGSDFNAPAKGGPPGA